MRYSEAEDQMWYRHGRTVLHPKDAFDDAIRNGMDEEASGTICICIRARRCTFSSTVDTREYASTTECIGTSGSDISFYEAPVRFVPITQVFTNC